MQPLQASLSACCVAGSAAFASLDQQPAGGQRGANAGMADLADQFGGELDLPSLQCCVCSCTFDQQVM